MKSFTYLFYDRGISRNYLINFLLSLKFLAVVNLLYLTAKDKVDSKFFIPL